MMARGYYDAACPLRQNLTRYRPVYYWLEYWGDWLGPRGDREFPEIPINPIARLMMRGKNYIRATADSVWSNDLNTLEKALAPLRIAGVQMRRIDPLHLDHYRVLYRLHNRKWALDQIARDENLHYKTLDTKLSEAYNVVLSNIFARDPTLYARQPPEWI